jgi:calpain-type cysteine protease DEK1
VSFPSFPTFLSEFASLRLSFVALFSLVLLTPFCPLSVLSWKGDVCQGALGDCWFLGALRCVLCVCGCVYAVFLTPISLYSRSKTSVIGTREDLLHHVVVRTEPQEGYYIFQFFKEGAWRRVKIDDRIPCRDLGDGKTFSPLYARSPDPNEIWVSLMEKACTLGFLFLFPLSLSSSFCLL